MRTPTCSTCKTELEQGFIPEATAGGFFVSVWHRGDASTEKKNWKERIASPAGIRYDHDALLAIDAMRCPTCGRIELFATRTPEKGESL